MANLMRTYNLGSAATTTMITGDAGITQAGSVRFYNASANDATVTIKVDDNSGGASEVVISKHVLAQGETGWASGDVNLDTGDSLKLQLEGSDLNLNVVHSYVDNT